ncbi:MAG: hypothetical protein K0B11_19435 [Mariniphaga sp.]|nr:hypothetical protein [Mariniphaga sp.]
MRKIRRILLGLVCFTLISLSFLQSNTKSNLDLHLEGLLNISQAQAESGNGDCSSFGFKDSNQPGYTLDGYDCDCNEREDVKTEC